MQTHKMKEELEIIEVSNAQSSIKIALQGAHVFHFQVKGQSPLLFVSETSHFEKGKAIRGGIPLCWPWFGAHPTDSTLPNHGFARTSIWTHVLTKEIDDDTTKIILELKESTETLKLWPYAFVLTLEIVLSDHLELSLISQNTGTETFLLTQALHSYLQIKDISSACITGAEQAKYYDKLNDSYDNIQEGEICFPHEVDRVYYGLTNPLKVEHIKIETLGSHTVVVWNPGPDFQQSFSDLHDYRHMLCIESANALKDNVRLNPKQTYILKTILTKKDS